MTVSSRTTDSPMSVDRSRSSMSGGSGTIISSTTAMTAAGASREDARPAFWRGVKPGEVVEVVLMSSQHQLLDPHEVREHLGDGAEERRWDDIADLASLVE